jgi:hypothetical protein
MMADLNQPTPCLVPLEDDLQHYQVVKQTVIPPQHFIGEDDVVSTQPIRFVFVVAEGDLSQDEPACI